MNKAFLWVLVVVTALASAVILYYGLQRLRPEPRPTAPRAAAPQPSPQPRGAPQIRYPIPTEEKPLPPLNESDTAVQEAAAGLIGDASLSALLNPQELVRRMVATIDNLPQRRLSLRLMPVKPAGGAFLTAGKNESTAIGPANAARYSRYVRLMEAVDTRQLVAAYVRFYPLFQQAYRELGYPDAHFNDRLVDVIDNLLAAPDAAEPVRLVRPKVFYEFADAELEALPAGQKILIRIGPANAAKVKAKLREIRGELTTQAARP